MTSRLPLKPSVKVLGWSSCERLQKGFRPFSVNQLPVSIFAFLQVKGSLLWSCNSLTLSHLFTGSERRGVFLLRFRVRCRYYGTFNGSPIRHFIPYQSSEREKGERKRE